MTLNTIAAIITAPGKAAVSIIRISGKSSWNILHKITKLQPKQIKAGEFRLCWIYSDIKKNIKLDQALILPFKAPHSFTGEDIIEIQCHGGIWIAQAILKLALESGARLAKPGEYSERAFLNGKMDLSQAEAIVDMIDARTDKSASNAIKIYEGYLGKEIKEIRNNLIEIQSELIACIDFPDEVTEYPAEDYGKHLNSIETKIKKLLEGAKYGRIIREGVKIAIVGEPNAGKSSLLNQILKEERAIVTEIEGTTRDLIEESYNLAGFPVVLLDTAGIRDSSDRVEQIGIEKSFQAINAADLILWLTDASKYQASSKPSKLEQQLQSLDSQKIIKIANKSDLLNASATELSNKFDVIISATKNKNLDTLSKLIADRITKFSSQNDSQNPSINQRQENLLNESLVSLSRSLEAAQNGLAHDFWTIDLKDAIFKLGEITGESLTEELLDKMFSSFCIGK